MIVSNTHFVILIIHGTLIGFLSNNKDYLTHSFENIQGNTLINYVTCKGCEEKVPKNWPKRTSNPVIVCLKIFSFLKILVLFDYFL